VAGAERAQFRRRAKPVAAVDRSLQGRNLSVFIELGMNQALDDSENKRGRNAEH
jgi:hypothetical protein